eukprot:COSAG02_NODE_2653_length_8320_cov_4.343511_4_plen_113_part_00
MAWRGWMGATKKRGFQWLHAPAVACDRLENVPDVALASHQHPQRLVRIPSPRGRAGRCLEVDRRREPPEEGGPHPLQLRHEFLIYPSVANAYGSSVGRGAELLAKMAAASAA